MKEIAILLVLTVTFSGCGATSTPVQTAVGGNWSAQLINTESGLGGFSFITNFTVSGTGGILSFSSFQFLNSQGCFPINGESPSGSVGNLQINQTTFQVIGTFNFAVASGGNTLTLSGTLTGTENGVNGTILSGGTVTGTWSVTGSCVPSGTTVAGNFTMSQASS